MPTRKTKEKFLEQCFEKHGNKYDYSLVEYINGNTNIKIICDRLKHIIIRNICAFKKLVNFP